MIGKITITFCASRKQENSAVIWTLGGDSGNDFPETSTIQVLSLEDKGGNIAYSGFVLIAFGNFIPLLNSECGYWWLTISVHLDLLMHSRDCSLAAALPIPIIDYLGLPKH